MSHSPAGIVNQTPRTIRSYIVDIFTPNPRFFLTRLTRKSWFTSRHTSLNPRILTQNSHALPTSIQGVFQLSNSDGTDQFRTVLLNETCDRSVRVYSHGFLFVLAVNRIACAGRACAGRACAGRAPVSSRAPRRVAMPTTWERTHHANPDARQHPHHTPTLRSLEPYSAQPILRGLHEKNSVTLFDIVNSESLVQRYIQLFFHRTE